MGKEHTIIVIGRSFGAGGKSIGKVLSEKLGIPIYDNTLLNESAKEFGFSRDIFCRVDEKRPSRFKRFVTQSYGVQESYIYDAISNETLYQAQSRVIRAIAEHGPCIIVGRTSDYVLRDFPGLVSVFVHAPLAYRAQKIVERGDATTPEEAIELAKRKDKSREKYYNYFTGRYWGVASNYDLCLDSSLLPVGDSAEVIAGFVRRLEAANRSFGEKIEKNF